MLRVSSLLPTGNTETPGASLQVEWFYMTFHKLDRVESVQSGQKVHNKTLQTLTKYFQLIHETYGTMAAYNTIRLRRFVQKKSASCVKSWRSNARASCAILPTSTGATDRTGDAMMANIVETTVNVSTPSFVTVADATTTSVG